jgi:hypothetical protein
MITMIVGIGNMTYDLRYEIILFRVVDWSRYKNMESRIKYYFMF